MNTHLVVLALLAALGCALNAGVFFAFSGFVMPALGRLQTRQGIAAMQSINVKALTPPFMAAFFGAAALSLAAAIAALVDWDSSYGPQLIAAAALYLIGTIGVTIARNVPLNDELARCDPSADDAAGLWARYLSRWTAWNHVRTVAPLIAAALQIWALHAG